MIRLLQLIAFCGVAMLAWARTAAGQDSVVIIRGGSVQPAAPSATTNAGSYARRVGRLPVFLTPDECQRLVSFRDHDLARAARSTLSKIDDGERTEADLTELRHELEVALTENDLFAAREAVYYTARRVFDAVRAATDLASFLSLPSGAPKTLGQIVLDIAKKGTDAGRDAVIEGKLDDYRRQMNQAATDLDGSIRRFMEETKLVREARDIGRVQDEMRDLLRNRIPEVDSRINALHIASTEARRELPQINDELTAIDATLRRACR